MFFQAEKNVNKMLFSRKLESLKTEEASKKQHCNKCGKGNVFNCVKKKKPFISSHQE